MRGPWCHSPAAPWRTTCRHRNPAPPVRHLRVSASGFDDANRVGIRDLAHAIAGCVSKGSERNLLGSEVGERHDGAPLGHDRAEVRDHRDSRVGRGRRRRQVAVAGGLQKRLGHLRAVSERVDEEINLSHTRPGSVAGQNGCSLAGVPESWLESVRLARCQVGHGKKNTPCHSQP